MVNFFILPMEPCTVRLLRSRAPELRLHQHNGDDLVEFLVLEKGGLGGQRAHFVERWSPSPLLFPIHLAWERSPDWNRTAQGPRVKRVRNSKAEDGKTHG